MEEGEPISVWSRLASKAKEDPLVPVGAAATVGFLVAGLWSFRTGRKALSQKMMRGRVVAQGATLVLLVAGLGMSSAKKDGHRMTVEEKFRQTLSVPNEWVRQADRGREDDGNGRV